jgi:hypothetical protein
MISARILITRSGKKNSIETPWIRMLSAACIVDEKDSAATKKRATETSSIRAGVVLKHDFSNFEGDSPVGLKTNPIT